jgi:Fur family zinc uptake transcriptional regulator
MNPEEMMDRLKAAGYKFTGKRRLIIEIFLRHRDHYLTAKDVLAEVQEVYPHVSPDTIYRTIALLERLRIVETLDFADDAAKYRLACEAGHHHHLVCLRCGSITPLPSCPMAQVEGVVGDFSVVHHRFEIYGYCKACQ